MPGLPDVFYQKWNRIIGAGPANPVFNVGGKVKAVLADSDSREANITTSGELWTTETERESDVWVQYAATFSADTYVVLVSLNNVAFPHKIQGQNGTRLDGTSIYYAIDLAANTSAVLKLGVITRINGTNADIKFFAGIPFLTGVNQDTIVESLRGVPSQVKLDFDDNGVLQHGITNTFDDDVAAVNTATDLQSPAGLIKPGLGDIIMFYDHSGGSSDLAVFVFYHNTD